MDPSRADRAIAQIRRGDPLSYLPHLWIRRRRQPLKTNLPFRILIVKAVENQAVQVNIEIDELPESAARKSRPRIERFEFPHVFARGAARRKKQPG